MSQKPTGVFVRLPLSEEQVESVLNSYTGDKESTNICMQKTILDLGTPVTGGDLEVFDIVDAAYGSSSAQYVRQSDAQAQIAALEAEVVRLRGVIVEAVDALTRVTEERSTQYQAKNGRWVSIQADDGERCDIIHSDITTDCEAAILSAHKALKGGAA